MNYGQQPNFYTSHKLYDGTDYENPSKYKLLMSGYKVTEQKVENFDQVTFEDVENLDQATFVINYIKGLK